MTTHTYFVINPKARQRGAQINYFLWRSGAWMGLVLLLCSGLGLMAVTALTSQFFLFLLAAMTTLPPLALVGYYGTSYARHNILTFRVNSGSASAFQQKWCDELVRLHGVEAQVLAFLKPLHKDDYSYGPATDALRAVRQILWDATLQYNQLLAFIINLRDTTRKELQEELRIVIRQVDQCQIIADKAMLIGVKSSSFTHMAKADLDELVEAFSCMISSLEELDEASKFALGPVPNGSSNGAAEDDPYDVGYAEESILEQERALAGVHVDELKQGIRDKEAARLQALVDEHRRLEKEALRINRANRWWLGPKTPSQGPDKYVQEWIRTHRHNGTQSHGPE